MYSFIYGMVFCSLNCAHRNYLDDCTLTKHKPQDKNGKSLVNDQYGKKDWTSDKRNVYTSFDNNDIDKSLKQLFAFLFLLLYPLLNRTAGVVSMRLHRRLSNIQYSVQCWSLKHMVHGIYTKKKIANDNQKLFISIWSHAGNATYHFCILWNTCQFFLYFIFFFCFSFCRPNIKHTIWQNNGDSETIDRNC